MAIELIDKIKPKNGGSFPMVDAADVQMGDGNRLSAFAEGVASKEYVHDYVQDFVPDVPEGAATEEYVQQYVNDFASDFLDTTLTASGKAAESAAVGQYFTQAMLTFGSELANKQPKGNYVKTVNGQTPDADGNVVVEVGGGGVSETVILAEQNFTSTLDSTYGYFNTAQPSAAFAVGQTYKVVMDGVEHTCEGVDASAFMAGGVFFGNGKNFGFPDTGEPFAAIFTPQNNVVSIMYLEDTAPTTHTVAIYQVSEDALATESFVKSYVEQYISEALGGDY